MKRIFLLCGIIAIMLSACEVSINSTEKATIKITSKDSLSVGSGNGQGIITYELIDPVEGCTVEATADVEWINSFNYREMGKIEYKVDANITYDERVGVITISYGDYSTNVTVTQKGKDRPEEIVTESPYILGHYYGDYAGFNYNYYIALSESDYDANDSFYAAGYKYFLDIYSDQRPDDYNHIRIPNGVYTFNPDNDGRAGTFLESYSIYKVYDANGNQIGEETFAEGTLTVTDDLVKLEIIFNGSENLNVVTFTGDYKMLDYRQQAGGIF